MKLIVSGGGTGGHFFPALAVITEALKRRIETTYIGSLRGIEQQLKELIPPERIFLEVLPFSGTSSIGKLRAALSYLKASLQLFEYVGEDSKALIFGGYVSVPTALTVIGKRKPLFLHEQNSVPGRANRLLSNFSEKVFITFEYSRRFFKGKEVIKTGLPVRESIFSTKLSKGSAKSTFGVEEKEPLILFFGGSQGARFVNNLAVEFASKTGVQVILISGISEYEVVKEKSKGVGNLQVYPFRKDMGLIYSACDVAVCRAGASSLTELSLFGVPAVMIPYPYAVANHQFYNAKEIEELGGGITLEQPQASLNKVVESVDSIIGDYERFSSAIKKFACAEAPKKILDEAL